MAERRLFQEISAKHRLISEVEFRALLRLVSFHLPLALVNEPEQSPQPSDLFSALLAAVAWVFHGFTSLALSIASEYLNASRTSHFFDKSDWPRASIPCNAAAAK